MKALFALLRTGYVAEPDASTFDKLVLNLLAGTGLLVTARRPWPHLTWGGGVERTYWLTRKGARRYGVR